MIQNIGTFIGLSVGAMVVTGILTLMLRKAAGNTVKAAAISTLFFSVIMFFSSDAKAMTAFPIGGGIVCLIALFRARR